MVISDPCNPLTIATLDPKNSTYILIDPDIKKIDFATVLKFDKDEVIKEYKSYQKIDEEDRSPPDEDRDQVTIRFIYLTIYLDVSERISENKGTEDLVLFEFGTTGTKMSILFDESPSIRETFIRLLKKNHGLCGVFNREVDWPELFWLKGKRYSKSIRSAFMLPEEIEAELKKGW